MPSASPAHAVVKNTIASACEAAFREARSVAQKELGRLSADDPKTLTLTVEALLKTGFEQKQLSQAVGVSRTTISRWAQEQNIPRSPAFRRWAVETLREFLGAPPDILAETLAKRSRRARER